MVNGKSSTLFTRTGRKGTGFAPKQPKSLTDLLECRRISAQLKQTGGGTIQPRAEMAAKIPTLMAKGHKRISTGEDASNNRTQNPPIPTNSSSTPRRGKVTFLTPSQQVVQSRRLSVPEESFNRPLNSILKKRHSVSLEYKGPTPKSDQNDLSIFWTFPWERGPCLPPISSSGTLDFLDKDGSLPPMLRRLSNADTYKYSQEFLQALDDLKTRPSSSQHNDSTCR